VGRSGPRNFSSAPAISIGGKIVTITPAERLLAVRGLGYAIAIIEKMPGHWLRPLFRYELAELFEHLNPEEPKHEAPPKVLTLARRHVEKLKIQEINCAAVEEPQKQRASGRRGDDLPTRPGKHNGETA
jgi:hypothetical protein